MNLSLSNFRFPYDSFPRYRPLCRSSFGELDLRGGGVDLCELCFGALCLGALSLGPEWVVLDSVCGRVSLARLPFSPNEWNPSFDVDLLPGLDPTRASFGDMAGA